MSKKPKAAAAKDPGKKGKQKSGQKLAALKPQKDDAKKPGKAAKATAPTTKLKPAKILRAAEIGASQEQFSNRWNPNSEIHDVDLAKLGGLARTGVSIARVPPGKESFLPHAHYCEEEWVYILMGQAKALIGDKEHDVGAGDFIAYPTPQVVHHLRNVGDIDLVYLMGGENAEVEIIDYPTIGKRQMRVGSTRTVFPLDAAEVLTPPKSVKSTK